MIKKKKVKKTEVKPENTDFVLDEKELEKVSGGAGQVCTEVGIGNPICTKTGMSERCSEVGVCLPDCTKAGV